MALLAPRANAGAPAIPAQPEGWSLHSSTAGIVLSSPPDDTNNIVLFVIDKAAPAAATPPPASPLTHTAGQFAELTQSGATRFGRLTWRQGVTLEDTLLRDAVTIEDPGGEIIHGYSFAYATPQGLQTLAVYWPAPLTAQSPHVAQALDHVAALWRIRFAYDATTSEIAPLPAPTPPVTAARN